MSNVRSVGNEAIAVTLNGEARDIATGTTLAMLVDALAGRSEGVAVAVDREIVPRSAWNHVVVQAGANVEVVSAAAGG